MSGYFQDDGQISLLLYQLTPSSYLAAHTHHDQVARTLPLVCLF